MKIKNRTGKMLIVTGVIILPLGAMYYFVFQGLALLLIVFGVAMIIPHKYIDKATREEFRQDGTVGSENLKDDYWRGELDEYGQSDSWSSHVGLDGGSGIGE